MWRQDGQEELIHPDSSCYLPFPPLLSPGEVYIGAAHYILIQYVRAVNLSEEEEAAFVEARWSGGVDSSRLIPLPPPFYHQRAANLPEEEEAAFVETRWSGGVDSSRLIPLPPFPAPSITRKGVYRCSTLHPDSVCESCQPI